MTDILFVSGHKLATILVFSEQQDIKLGKHFHQYFFIIENYSHLISRVLNFAKYHEPYMASIEFRDY